MTTQEYHGTTERERGKQIKNALRQPGRAKCVSGTMAYSVAALVSDTLQLAILATVFFIGVPYLNEKHKVAAKKHIYRFFV
mmetsp:Transcript_3589/g.6951  ORF Transcript_3589/g.6951 Transcript_3589/m.6951 type:complete len:81 (+) Transcript_3589:1413-1655(+)